MIHKGGINNQWTSICRFSRDLHGEASHPYQRVVYAVLALCDVPMERSAVALEIEDYLWVKLCRVISSWSVPHDSNALTLSGLQTSLSEEYGEASLFCN